MIKFNKGIAAITLAATLFAGFALPASAQTPPNVLVVGQIAEPSSLDPDNITAVNDFRIVFNVYDGLVRYKPGTLEVEPALAKSWDISEDGLTYTFHLRDGVKFHDGTPFNADAVKFKFDRMMDKENPYHDTANYPLSYLLAQVESAEVIDDLTVAITLTQPYAPFLSNMAYTSGLIMSPEAVKTYGKDAGRHPSGTGPFKFAEWQSNTRVVLEKNPDYWDGAPALDAVIFRPITDANTRVAEMLSGGVDLLTEVPPDNVATFAADSGFTVYDQSTPQIWFLILNAKDGPMADKRVRQAVNYAIDKQSMVDNVLQGTAVVASGPMPPAFTWAYNEALDPYPYDPEKAKALIAEAGMDGADVTFLVTEGGSSMLDPVPMGTAIQADLEAVGLNVKIETYEWNTFLGIVNPGLEGKGDMAEMSWTTNDPDTLPYLALRTDAWPDKGGFNSGYYSNPKVDALIEAAQIETDQDKRAALYKEMQEIVYDDAPWAFVANGNQIAVSSARVKDFTLEPSAFLLLHDVSKP